MSDDKPVNMCACLNQSFAQLKALGSLKAAEAAGAGVECGGCLPYLKLVFETGETAFAVDDPRLPVA
ncbi:MAG TPA: hypothetical protein VJ961_05105 [Mariprofundaceae bacterium]|nr:hypothetical protein [Mariprofundaceae bacterium]